MHNAMDYYLGGGFKYFFFSPLFGEHFQFDYYFSSGLKPPTIKFPTQLPPESPLKSLLDTNARQRFPRSVVQMPCSEMRHPGMATQWGSCGFLDVLSWRAGKWWEKLYWWLMRLTCLNYFNQGPIFDLSCGVLSLLVIVCQLWKYDAVHGDSSVSLATSELGRILNRRQSCDFKKRVWPVQNDVADPKILRLFQKYTQGTALPFTIILRIIKTFKIPRLSTRAYH